MFYDWEIIRLMKTTRNPYNHLPNFVLRTPLFDFDFYTKLTNGDVILDQVFKNVCQDPVVGEALFLASPTFYFVMKKWMAGKLDKKGQKKLRNTLLKYLTRMSTRCTPFGLFAGCSLGNFGDETEIKNLGPMCNTRHTRLDMNYLVALSQDLAKKRQIQYKLPFYPNSSLYQTGDKLRCIEYYYVNSNRQHRVIEVDNSSYLQQTLEHAAKGIHLKSLISGLISDDISKADAENFIHELVDSQILVSELEPSVSGPEFMDQIMETLKKVGDSQGELENLTITKKLLANIDAKLGNPTKVYLDLAKQIEKLSTPYDLKYLFQTDMTINPQKNQLSKSVIKDIGKGMELLNKMTLSSSLANANLNAFKEAFLERYEQREMPLSTVLDIETGIGYMQNANSGDINPLVDDILLPVLQNVYDQEQFNWTRIHDVLHMKLLQCDKNGAYKIVLKEEDFEELPLNWEDLPDTIATMAAFVVDEGVKKIHFPGFRGASAACLMGRFCHGDRGIRDHVQKIIELEQSMNPDKVLAEIVHLPEARVGNVIMRPKLREYEIPYLAKSSLAYENQLSIDDLYISLRNDYIVLRSKKLDKEVLPRLTNAHNFSLSTLPIYQFLCDMQTQNVRYDLFFDYGPLKDKRDFLPRVEFGNLILHRAQWKLKKEEIKTLLSKKEDVEALKELVTIFRNRKGLPEFVLLNDGEFRLLVNFKNMTSVQMMLHAVINRDQFTLSEFLFDEDSSVKSTNGYYSNQIIISFFNQAKLDLYNKV